MNETFFLSPKTIDRLSLLLILLLVSVMLLIHFGQVPPPLPWSDESEIAADAMDTLREGPQLFYRGAGGSLAVWLEAGWMALFGRSLLGLRLLNGLVNLVSVLLLYALVLEMPFPRPRRPLALAAALLLAASTWLLGLGRIAAPNWSLVPLMTNLAFLLFWRGLHTRRTAYFIAVAGVMGLLFYGYLPGALVPLVPGLFLVFVWLRGYPSNKDELIPPAPPEGREIPQVPPAGGRGAASQTQEKDKIPPFGGLGGPKAPLRWLILMTLTTALIATPMLLFTLFNPDSALQRPRQLTETNELTGGAILRDSLDFLATFGLWPDRLWQGQVESLAFDPLVTLLFVGGLLLSLWRWRDPAHFFLLLWWVVLMAPAFLSRSASTGFIFEVWRRGVGAQGASFIMAGLALVTGVEWLRRRWSKRGSSMASRHEKIKISPSGGLGGPNAPLLTLTTILLVTLISARLSYRFYFEQWANSGIIPIIFNRGPTDLVRWLEAGAEADMLYLFPVRPTASHNTRPELFTVRYLYEGAAATAYPKLDEATIDATLDKLLTAEVDRVKLMLPDRIAVDPKGYFAYALGSRGELIGQEEAVGFTVQTYRLRPSVPATTLPQAATVGDLFQVTTLDLRPARPAAGQTLGLALTWQLLVPQPVDYNVSLTLHDEQGFEWAKADKPLLRPVDYLTTRHWPPGQVSTLYATLPIPPDAPPGNYSVTAVVYEAERGARLTPTGATGAGLPLTSLSVAPNPSPVPVSDLPIPQTIERDLLDGLRLVGMGDLPATLRPGERLPLTLWWQATTDLNANLGLMPALARPGEAPLLLFDAPRSLLDKWPTPTWPSGHIYRAVDRPLLPATLSGDTYQLILGLVDLDRGATLAQHPLAPLTITSREHIFERPSLAQPVNRDFDDLIRLRSVELQPPADQTLPLTLQWQALAEITTSYKMFVHLTDEGGEIISQIDTLPQQGAAPTTGWLPDELIEETLHLPLPPDRAPDAARLLIGWYDPNTGQRLRSAGQDHVSLESAGVFVGN